MIERKLIRMATAVGAAWGSRASCSHGQKTKLADLLAQCDPSAPYASEVWPDVAPVGREFGAHASDATMPLERLQGTVQRYDHPTDPIWPSKTADYAVRVMDAQTLAREVFDDPTVAMQWLLSATPLLDDMRPIDALATVGGHERVRALLLRIAHGGSV